MGFVLYNVLCFLGLDVVLLCSVVSVWGVVSFVLSVMRVVGCSFMGNMCVSSCKCCVGACCTILSAVFCIICEFCF